MHLVTKFLRWFAHKISIALLANAVTVGIPLLAVSVHLTNPSVIKGWLNQTDTYEHVVEESLGLIALESESSAANPASLEDTFEQNPFINTDDIVNALAESITPTFLEEQTSNVIDGTYPWLKGDADEPNFSFSIAAKQEEVGQRLAKTLKKDLANLPECLPEELTPDFSITETLCLPPGIDINSEVDRFVADFTGEQGLFADTEFTHEDIIKRDGEESGLDEGDLKTGQQIYSSLKNGPILFIILGVISSFVVYFTSKSRYKGFSEVGNTIFSGSLFIFGTSLILSRFEQLITNFIGENDSSNTTVKAARAIFEPLLERIIHDIASLTVIFSGSALALGSFMVGFSFYLKRRYQREEAELMEKEWREAAESARVKEIRKLAKKHPKKYAHLTKDPETKKPLKVSKEQITVHHARKIARDPASKKRTIRDIRKEVEK